MAKKKFYIAAVEGKIHQFAWGHSEAEARSALEKRGFRVLSISEKPRPRRGHKR